MVLSKQMAKHFREIYFGGNWTASNLKDHLSDVDWEMATKKVGSLNTIATLAYHISYYVSAALEVFKGNPLNAKDELTFNHPPITCDEDWQSFLSQIWSDATEFSQFLEDLPEQKMWEHFTDEKYGIYFRNVNGIIEHSHYHLGQIAVIKKLLK